MKAILIALVSLCAASASFAQTDVAGGDVEKGAKVFRKCAACHSIEADAPHRAGPSLYGVLNRPVASAEDFNYSQVLRDAGKAGDVWDDERFLSFTENPKAVYMGNKMAFAGLRKPEERINLLAYFKANQPAE